MVHIQVAVVKCCLPNIPSQHQVRASVSFIHNCHYVTCACLVESCAPISTTFNRSSFNCTSHNDTVYNRLNRRIYYLFHSSSVGFCYVQFRIITPPSRVLCTLVQPILSLLGNYRYYPIYNVCWFPYMMHNVIMTIIFM